MASPEMERFSVIIREQRTAQPTSVADRRQQMEQTQSRLRIPEDISSEDVVIGGCPARWVSAPGSRADQVVLFYHGGGYALGSLNTHHELMGRVARATGAKVLGIDYRLAPEAPFPAAFDDALAAYDALLDDGVEAQSIMLAGDSAGGGLALAVLLAIRDSSRPMPAGAVLMSPWTDLTGSGESITSRAEIDPMVKPEQLLEFARSYRGDTTPRDPRVSPLFGTMEGLPPLLVQVGEAEILLDDATRVVNAAHAAGSEAELQIWEGAFHVFQSLPQLPEAAEALAAIGAFFTTHTSSLSDRIDKGRAPDPERRTG